MGNSIFPEVGGSGGTPGGTNTQVQFNDSGAFGGDAAFTWDKSANLVGFSAAAGLSFTAASSGGNGPITMVGGDSGHDDPALIISNPTDDYLIVRFTEYAQLNFDGDGGFVGDLGFTGNTDFFGGVNQSDTVTTLASGTTRKNAFNATVTATDGVDASIFVGLRAGVNWGNGGVASVGTAIANENAVIVAGAGDADNEYAHTFGVVRGDIGTSYTQTTGPFGRIYGVDWTTLGPIGVQAKGIHGAVINVENYYNGSSTQGKNAGLWVVTAPGTGGGIDAAHSAGTTFPMDVGIGIVGVASSAGIGFTTGLQIGGSGSPWEEAASKIGTGINISQYGTAGININAASATTAPSIIFDTFLQTSEMTAPAAPAANGVRIYAQDSGGGKTQLMALFSSGAAQQLAIQP